MKYILVIGDGMADNPIESLGGKTPLQYAAIPTIDTLAEKGRVGQVLTIPEGQPAGSDTAFLSIFGCDPRVYNKGRAPLEAAATGIVVAPGSAAYRCNMVAFEDIDAPFEAKRILSHSGGEVEAEEALALAEALLADPAFKAAADEAGLTIHPNPGFRHIAVQTGADLTGFVAQPPHEHLGQVIGPLLPKGNATADALRALMEQAHGILDPHPINGARRAAGKLPANGVWFWAEGQATELPQFRDTFGHTGGVISAVPLCHGIGILTGLIPITVEGATGKLHTNYEGKVEATVKSLGENGDFVTVHIEAPDECTHNGDLEGKLQAIEWIDSRVVSYLLDCLEQAGITDYRMLILSDHKTLMATRGHDGEPVPFLLYDSRISGNSGQVYTEADAARGEYLHDGTKILNLLFDHER
ncbi:MAG: 2,3-bisphosphoglycerate-independent phosphoglycerate mutase [Oscillospiraceae bacterium]|nr:2,3-bisphosphoglycerate-independent phosphoglycerate mutase [Oscillospiraceae bacterium]